MARPTNGGTDAIDRSLQRETIDPRQGRPPMRLQAFARPAGVALKRLVAVDRRRPPSESRHSLSMIAGDLGKTSPIWMPGTLVEIGLKLAADLRGGLGLDLPHVLVRRSAAQEDVDHRLWLLRPVLASARNRSASDNAPRRCRKLRSEETHGATSRRRIPFVGGQ